MPNKWKSRGDRIPLKVMIDISQDGHSERTFSLNLAEGGLYFATKFSFQKNSKVDITITLPNNRKQLHLKGKVTRSQKDKQLPDLTGIGIQFENVNKADRNLLVEAVAYLTSLKKENSRE